MIFFSHSGTRQAKPRGQDLFVVVTDEPWPPAGLVGLWGNRRMGRPQRRSRKGYWVKWGRMRGVSCALEIELLTGDRCLRCSSFIEMPFRWRGLEELPTSTYFYQLCLPIALLFLQTATRACACAVCCWSGMMISTSYQFSSAPNSSNGHSIREHQRRKRNEKVAFLE